MRTVSLPRVVESKPIVKTMLSPGFKERWESER